MSTIGFASRRGRAGSGVVGHVAARGQCTARLSGWKLNGRRPAVVYRAIPVEPRNVSVAGGRTRDVTGASEAAPEKYAAIESSRRKEPDAGLVGNEEFFRCQLGVPGCQVSGVREWICGGSGTRVSACGERRSETQADRRRGRREAPPVATYSATPIGEVSPQAVEFVMNHLASRSHRWPGSAANSLTYVAAFGFRTAHGFRVCGVDGSPPHVRVNPDSILERWFRVKPAMDQPTNRPLAVSARGTRFVSALRIGGVVAERVCPT
jgi:hypothetical protein